MHEPIIVDGGLYLGGVNLPPKRLGKYGQVVIEKIESSQEIYLTFKPKLAPFTRQTPNCLMACKDNSVRFSSYSGSIDQPVHEFLTVEEAKALLEDLKSALGSLEKLL